MTENTTWKSLYIISGVSAWIFVLYSLITMIVLIVIGGMPETAAEGFSMLQEHRLVGILRLDTLTLLIMPLYYPIFLGMYIILKKSQPAMATLGALLAFAGVTLFLATPSAFSFITLSDRYAAAATPDQQELYLAAGEALLAADMWHGSGAMIGGILMLIAALILSVVMLKSPKFSRATAIVGIITHALDLAHILLGIFIPQLGVILMAIAGPLYLVWFPLLARDFFRSARADQSSHPKEFSGEN